MIAGTNMVLDYKEHSLFKTEYGLNFPGSLPLQFFGKLGWCPFCAKDASVIHNKNTSFYYEFGPRRDMTEDVWQCSCGWWQIRYFSYMEDEPEYGEQEYKDWQSIIHSAQLRKFDIGAKDIPIDILRSYLCQHENKIYNINDKKMEELVASVFREHFDCEVRIVGKSHDGGVDLLMIDGKEQTAVQVKRRESPNKTESVKEVRDFLGATLISDSTKSIFVTTADHFSRDAINTRDKIIEKKFVQSFDLLDYRSFMDMLQLHTENPTLIWQKYLQFDKNLPSEESIKKY